MPMETTTKLMWGIDPEWPEEGPPVRGLTNERLLAEIRGFEGMQQDHPLDWIIPPYVKELYKELDERTAAN